MKRWRVRFQCLALMNTHVEICAHVSPLRFGILVVKMITRVLVVEDEKRSRRTLSMMLRAGGHEVSETADGRQALSYLERHPADVVVTDIIMPVMDGLKLITELRRRFPNVKIIAISGGTRSSGADALNTAKALGANRILAKQFRQDEIPAMVDELCDRDDVGYSP